MRSRGRGEQARAKDEVADVLDCKAGVRDRLEGVTACVAATTEIRPDDVERALGGGEAPILGAHMLVEAQFAARPQDAVQLGEHRALVGDRTEHQRRDRHVERGVLEWELVCDGVDHARRRDCVGRRRGCAGAQVGLGLDGDDLANAFGVVGEVGAGPSTDFNDCR